MEATKTSTTGIDRSTAETGTLNHSILFNLECPSSSSIVPSTSIACARSLRAQTEPATSCTNDATHFTASNGGIVHHREAVVQSQLRRFNAHARDCNRQCKPTGSSRPTTIVRVRPFRPAGATSAAPIWLHAIHRRLRTRTGALHLHARDPARLGSAAARLEALGAHKNLKFELEHPDARTLEPPSRVVARVLRRDCRVSVVGPLGWPARLRCSRTTQRRALRRCSATPRWIALKPLERSSRSGHSLSLLDRLSASKSACVVHSTWRSCRNTLRPRPRPRPSRSDTPKSLSSEPRSIKLAARDRGTRTSSSMDQPVSASPRCCSMRARTNPVRCTCLWIQNDRRRRVSAS